MTKSGFVFKAFLLCVSLLVPVLAQSTAPASKEAGWGNGHGFVAGLALMNLDSDTQDPGLFFGAGADVRISGPVLGTVSAGFLANGGNNDAFDDRSLMVTSGLKYQFHPATSDGFFLAAGHTYANGETSARNLAFGGVGYSRWYGELTGWQIEVRDHFNGDLNFVELRISFNIR